jgi:hypothetical protein
MPIEQIGEKKFIEIPGNQLFQLPPLIVEGQMYISAAKALELKTIAKKKVLKYLKILILPTKMLLNMYLQIFWKHT